MTFHVGQRVVCVDGRLPLNPIVRSVSEGTVYTIRDSGPESLVDGYWVLLVEITNIHTPTFGELGYNAKRFRPIVEDRKSVSFTMGADPESERWDNRKRVKERT